jgi:regulator of sirC expression with transglutaminase-like and TPR domain
MTEAETVEQINRLVPSMVIRPEVHLAVASTGDIVRRMLANLKPLYLKRQRLETVERLLRVQSELLPHDAMSWVERAAVLVALKRRRNAADVTTRALLEGGLEPGIAPQRIELMNLLAGQLARLN